MSVVKSIRSREIDLPVSCILTVLFWRTHSHNHKETYHNVENSYLSLALSQRITISIWGLCRRICVSQHTMFPDFSHSVKCSSIEVFRCSNVCERQLNCGKHSCQEVCHAGPCEPCKEVIKQGKRS